jgi:hypothetical protein
MVGFPDFQILLANPSPTIDPWAIPPQLRTGMHALLLAALVLAGIILHYRHRVRSPFTPTRFVWSRGLALLCDHQGGLQFVRDQHREGQSLRFDPGNFARVKDGDLVWMRATSLSQFVDEALPLIHARFTLVTGDEDWSMPSDFKRADELLDDPRLVCWFAQNFDGTSSHPKLHPLPIGLDFHSVANSGRWGEWPASPELQETELRQVIQQAKPNRERLLLVHADFHFNKPADSHPWENREMIHRKLKGHPDIQFQRNFLRRRWLWQEKARHAFVISPHGNGLDCHRTWESLVLGCIVIVKRSPLDPLYEGLPVVIVEDWDEIMTENLRLWHEQHRDAFDRPEVQEKLTNRYWIDRMRRITRERMG